MVKKTINQKKIKIDSTGEHHFLWYLSELNDHGFIKGVLWQEVSFILSEPLIWEYKTNKLSRKKDTRKKIVDLSKGFQYETKKRTILSEHKYTPEAIIIWDESAKGIFYDELLEQGLVFENRSPFIAQRTSIKEVEEQGFINEAITVVEVKPKFNFQNMNRAFKINQWFMWAKSNIYVELCFLPDLFYDTFLPERYLYTDKTMIPRKINKNYKLIQEYVYKRREIRDKK